MLFGINSKHLLSFFGLNVIKIIEFILIYLYMLF